MVAERKEIRPRGFRDWFFKSETEILEVGPVPFPTFHRYLPRSGYNPTVKIY